MWTKFLNLWKTSHEEATFSARRWRRIFQAAGAGAAGRIISITCSLVQIPIALRHLGSDSFGLWITLTSMVTLVNFADLGMGLGLQNLISRAHGKDAPHELNLAFRTGFLVLTGISALLLLGGLPIISHLDWAVLLNIHNSVLALDAKSSAMVVAIAFCVGIPLMTFQRVATGLQLGWLTSATACLGSILSLLFVLIASFLNMRLVAFITMVVLAPLLANIVLALMLRTHVRLFSSQERFFDSRMIRPLFKSGLMFLVPQIGATLMNAVPVVVLSAVCGPAAVTPYSLAQRIVGLASQAASMVLTPLWPAYAEAYVRGDVDWIKKTFRLSILAVVLGLPLPCLAFWLHGETLIRLWSSYQGELGFWFLGAMAAWLAVTTAGLVCAMFLNGLGRLRGQAIYGSLFVGCAILLLRPITEQIGMVGVPLTMTICYVIINLSCATIECFRVYRNLSGPVKFRFNSAPAL